MSKTQRFSSQEFDSVLLRNGPEISTASRLLEKIIEAFQIPPIAVSSTGTGAVEMIVETNQVLAAIANPAWEAIPLKISD